MTIMERKLKAMFGAMCALWCGLCLSQAGAQTLPDGVGKTEFIHNCTACHRADMVTAAKKTPENWKKSVAEMASRGADGSPEDLDKVTQYLSTFYALDATAPAQAAKPAPLTAAERDNITGVIADNGCLICHRIETQGGYIGPSLNGVGARRTPEQIRNAIVHPSPKLAPGNRLASITTADGKTVVARMMSEDDKTVRVVDMSGVVVTDTKTELRQFSIVDVNPMQSYEKRIAPEDLDPLVRYLGSLPALDEASQK